MKIDQIAYYCDTEYDERIVKSFFGLQDRQWIQDTVTAINYVSFASNLINKQRNIASLQFNYDLGIELEIIRYIEGLNWHQVDTSKVTPRMSHVGIHLDNGEDFPKKDGWHCVQETFTQSHTAEYLTTGAGAGRTYHYRIYQISQDNYIKYIKRVEQKP